MRRNDGSRLATPHTPYTVSVIRIIKNRKPVYLYIGHYIERKHWNKEERKVRKSHPNSTRLNNLIASKLAEANRTLIELQSSDTVISSRQIKKEIVEPLSDKSFYDLGQEYLNELASHNKLTQYSSDRVHISYVTEFAKSKNLSFREIDEAFLKKYMSFLKVEKGNGQRSVINSLVVIRTLYNRAIRQGLVDRKHYPFGKGKIQIKFPETEKIGLSAEEVQAIESADDLTPQEQHTRNVWLFSFYLAGMRAADVLKIRWSDICDGRLHYRMNKNEKLLSLKLPDKAFGVLKCYEDDKQNPERRCGKNKNGN